MVALPQIGSPTLEAADFVEEAGQESRQQRRLSGSLIGKKCERRIWYTFNWAQPPERHKAKMLRLFRTGHLEEPRALETLEKAGVDVSAFDPSTGEQWTFTELDGHFVVKIDGRGTGFKEAPKAEHIIGIKTHNDAHFKQLLKHGISESHPEHMAQAQTEMHCSGIHRFFYYAKNKNDDDTYRGSDQRIHYDPARALALMAKAERIRDAQEAPPRISDDPSSFLCRFCKSNAVCHGREMALRNCRTCLHRSPVSGGAWHCARHDMMLSVETQESGCPHHRYLPTFIDGEQIDADEASETVTYRLRDGSEWIDGGERQQEAAQ